jgi:hypothetical protein
MELTLPHGMSCCEAGGRFIFLDFHRDRYFALSTEAERSFRRLVAREALGPEDHAHIGSLVDDGLLVPAFDGARPQPCPAPPLPTQSLLDAQHRAGAFALAHALCRLALGILAVKVRPLAAILGRLEARKAAHGPAHARRGPALLEVAAAFRRSSLIAAPLDQCLPRSIALAHALIDRDMAPLLVIGVRLQPFAAHCWVQLGGTLVNEHLDHVRNFTPILVV